MVLKQLKEDQRIQLQASEEQVRKDIELEIQKHFTQEEELMDEVYQMMEDLENQGHQFERQKMFPILKKQLAKKKGIIL